MDLLIILTDQLKFLSDQMSKNLKQWRETGDEFYLKEANSDLFEIQSYTDSIRSRAKELQGMIVPEGTEPGDFLNDMTVPVDDTAGGRDIGTLKTKDV